MRIGFVSIQDSLNVGSFSGIPFHILNHMYAQRVDVQLLSPLSSSAKYLFAPAKLTAKVAGKTLSLDHFRIVLHHYARQIERFVRDRSIDVVFSPSTIPITVLKCGKPIITWTDAVFQHMNDYYTNAFTNLTAAAVKRGFWQEETALHNCTIAAFSSGWALEGARRLTNDDKLRILPFGSSLPVRHTKEEVVRWAAEKRTKRRKQCELLFVGCDWERKGGTVAVETARLLNESGIETRLQVVGSRPDGEMPPFVNILGFINKGSEAGMQRLIDLFMTADVFILPTRAEAAGIVFSEASSYGLPSITYATGGVPDYVRNGVNGVCVEPGSPATTFAREITKLLTDSAAYESCAIGGFREYQERLNWKTSVSKLLGFCAECARTSGGNRVVGA